MNNRRLLGCVYVDPPGKIGFDTEVYHWVPADELGTGLEQALDETVRHWISEKWSFEAVAYPGRDHLWEEWYVLPDGGSKPPWSPSRSRNTLASAAISDSDNCRASLTWRQSPAGT
jgi:hypothetical protein